MGQLKQAPFKITKGMNQDVEFGSFSPEFAFSLTNLKNQSNDNNNQGALTNEKGTKRILLFDSNRNEVQISGKVIGIVQCTQDIAVLFSSNNNIDYIYKIEYSSTGGILIATILAEGIFNFGDYISGIFCYENSELQKVYWVDGKNPLRYINIANDYQIQNANELSTNPTFNLNHHITVEKQVGGGTFTAGVIQYAFTYYRENGPETGIVDMTPLYYVSENTRGIAADETVGCSFKVTIQNPDTSFDYIRLYSIQRHSLNGTPVVKIVKDIKLH